MNKITNIHIKIVFWPNFRRLVPLMRCVWHTYFIGYVQMNDPGSRHVLSQSMRQQGSSNTFNIHLLFVQRDGNRVHAIPLSSRLLLQLGYQSFLVKCFPHSCSCGPHNTYTGPVRHIQVTKEFTIICTLIACALAHLDMLCNNW